MSTTDTATPAQATYRIDFARIGRTTSPPSLTVTVTEDADVAYALAEKVHGHARQYLMSREIEAHVHLGDTPADGGTVTILTGGARDGGTGTVTVVAPEAVDFGKAGLRIAVDADCPGCGYPERSFDPSTGTFACSGTNPSKCDYTSQSREA